VCSSQIVQNADGEFFWLAGEADRALFRRLRTDNLNNRLKLKATPVKHAVKEGKG
jgi:hypothetical protein